MGTIVSKVLFFSPFSKNPDVYKKELEELNKEILKMEQKKQLLEHQYCLITQFILSYSRLLYFVLITIYIFSTLPSTFVEYIFFCGPVLIFYFLILGLKKSLKWLYDHEIKKIEKKASTLQLRKTSVLKEIRKKVTFRDARDIISEYYLPEQDKFAVDIINGFECNSKASRSSSVDNIAKYIFNEEKENALICKFCHCHNGLAVKEEFNCTSFRCRCCFKLNRAKKGSASTAVIKT